MFYFIISCLVRSIYYLCRKVLKFWKRFSLIDFKFDFFFKMKNKFTENNDWYYCLYFLCVLFFPRIFLWFRKFGSPTILQLLFWRFFFSNIYVNIANDTIWWFPYFFCVCVCVSPSYSFSTLFFYVKKLFSDFRCNDLGLWTKKNPYTKTVRPERI